MCKGYEQGGIRDALSPQPSTLNPQPWVHLVVARAAEVEFIALIARIPGSGFRVQGAGCRVGVQGAGCRVQGSGFRVQGAGCRVQGAGFRVEVEGVWFGV